MYRKKVEIPMASWLTCDIIVNKIKLYSRYYIHFWTNTLEKGMHPLDPQVWVK